MSNEIYDVLVLGGGSAGSAAAGEAVKKGAEKVAMINDGELGGLCILRGCMPTKTMLWSAELLHHFNHSSEIGIQVKNYSYDFAAIMNRKDALVKRFQRAKISGIEKGGYEVIKGRARFVSPEEVEVEGKKLRARTFVIATGSKVKVPPIPGIEDIDFLDSDDLMEIQSPPPSILVLGAGAVGLEFASFFAGLGTEVTLVNRSPLLRRGEDMELSEQYKNMLKDQGIEVLAPSDIRQAREDEKGKSLLISYEGEEREVKAHSFLLATGRVANLKGLNLEAAGIEYEGTKIAINENLQTSNPNVFVAGDATNDRLILHVATAQGRHVARNAMAWNRGERPEKWREEIPMEVIFTDHPYGEVGLTEKEATDDGLEVVSAQKNWANQGRGIVMNTRPHQGFIKMVAKKEDAKMVGAQILGPRADDLIHVISSVLHYGGTALDMVKMPWYHPTLSEAFIELARNLVNQSDLPESF